MTDYTPVLGANEFVVLTDVVIENTTLPQATGTGIFGTFEVLHSNTGTEYGFNTDATPLPYDDQQPHHTNALLLSALETVTGDPATMPGTVLGTTYYAFRLDLNEPGSSPLISLDQFKIYQAATGDIATTADLAAQGTLQYEMPTGLNLTAGWDAGSGKGDYVIYVPTSYLDSSAGNPNTYVYLVTQFGLAGGSYTAGGGFEEWGAYEKPVLAPSIVIEKQTKDLGNGTTDPAGTPGDGITVLENDHLEWIYTVTNNGNVALSNVTVTDDAGTPADTTDDFTATVVSDASGIVGDTDHDHTLDPGETWTFTATGTANGTDDHWYTNTATASGEYDGRHNTVTDEDTSSYFGAAAAIAIDKKTKDTASPSGTAQDGAYVLKNDTVQWIYTVTNPGNVALSDVTVKDDNGTPLDPSDDWYASYVSGDTNSDGKLDTDETWIFSASGIAGTGWYTNSATATGSFTDDAGHTVNPLSAPDESSYFGADPGLTIDKKTKDTASPAGTAQDGAYILTGESISWEYGVTNTGNVALTDPLVTDDQPGVTPAPILDPGGHNIGDTDDDGVFDPGETWRYEATGTAVAGNYSNVGSASSSYTDGAGHSRPASDDDPSSYIGANPHITLDKKTNGLDHNAAVIQGSTVTWTYVLTNDGNVSLSNPTVRDDAGTPASTADDFWANPVLSGGFNVGDTNQNGKLDPGESWRFVKTGTAQYGIYTNTATASTDAYADTAGHSRTPTASDTSDYAGLSNKVLSQGFWGSHMDAWDLTLTNASKPTLSAVKGGVLSAVEINPSTRANYLLLGDANGNGIADDAHDLWISTKLAQSILSSSTTGDARVIMLKQAIATQLNIDNIVNYRITHANADPAVVEPLNLIDEAVQWMTSDGAWVGAGVNLDPNHDGTIDQNIAGTALLGTAVSTSSNAWNKCVDVTDASSGIADWNGGLEANGEGLKNALEYFNTGRLVVAGSNVAWFSGGALSAVNPNTMDQFWVTLHEVPATIGIAH